MVLLLGLRHGMDADHLAAIDGMARLQGPGRRAPVRAGRGWCGALFALGHGAVVVLVAAAVSLSGQRWQAPGWLAQAGAWLSIGFLLALGVANLWAVWRTAPGQLVQGCGLRARLLLRGGSGSSGWSVAAVGALFAVSLDTVAQAAWMALAAAPHGGTGAAIALAASFTTGMLLADAAHSWWLGRLLRRADARAALASRCMAGAVAMVSLAVAALGMLRQLAPGLADAAPTGTIDSGLAGAGLLVAALALAYGVAMGLRGSRQPPAPRAAPAPQRALNPL
jgi:high-affinity nickel-transport protein